MTAAHTYSGGTTVTAGTLTGNTASLQGGVANNAAVVFDQAADGTYAGNMTGGGSLTKQLGGILTLTGTNSYSGGTTVSAGMLTGHTASLQGAIDNDAAVTFNQAAAGTYGGVMSGTGGLTKVGAGNLTLTAANTFAGGTTLTAGGLIINGSLASDVNAAAGTTVGGSGAINAALITAGRVAPGNSIGTMTVTDVTFNAGSVLEVEVDAAGNSDLLMVNDTATINGGTVEVLPSDGDYATSTTYTILTATTGVAGAGFDSVVNISGLAFLEPSLTLDANNVFLTLERNLATFEDIAVTDNQMAVATVLNEAALTASGDLATVLDAFVPLTTAEAQRGLELISGETLGAPASARVFGINKFASSVMGKFGGLARSGNTTVTAADEMLSHAEAGLGDVTHVEGSHRVWVDGYGDWGDIDGDRVASDIDYNTYGVTAGVDLFPHTNFMVGLAFGYGRSDIESDRDPAETDVDSYRGALYATYHGRSGYVSGLFSGGGADFESSRRIVYGTVDRTAEGDYSGYDISAMLEWGTYWSGEHYTFQPSISVQYTYIDQDDYTETGAGSLNLSVEDEDIDSYVMLVGGRVSRRFHTAGGTLIEPNVEVRWAHEYGDLDRVVNASLTGSPAAGTFRVNGATPDRDIALIGVGVTVQVSASTYFRANYQGGLSEDLTQHSFVAGLQYRW